MESYPSIVGLGHTVPAGWYMYEICKTVILKVSLQTSME